MATDSATKYDFYHKVVCSIPGWLEQGAAIRTLDMLEFQEDSGVTGSLLEIGVHAGRYFSILVRSAARTNARVVGIDLFGDPSVDMVKQLIAPVLGSSQATVILVQAHSTELDAASLLGHLNDRARFISIDGSHRCHDVFWDLRLAEQVVAPAGIVAVDDFINPVAFGVNEAVHRFFAQPRRLVPWAYIGNKLFLCQAHWSDRYKEMLKAQVMQDTVEPHSRFFQANMANVRHRIEQSLWGNSFLMLGP